jgi:hypothetical protein
MSVGIVNRNLSPKKNGNVFGAMSFTALDIWLDIYRQSG